MRAVPLDRRLGHLRRGPRNGRKHRPRALDVALRHGPTIAGQTQGIALMDVALHHSIDRALIQQTSLLVHGALDQLAGQFGLGRGLGRPQSALYVLKAVQLHHQAQPGEAERAFGAVNPLGRFLGRQGERVRVGQVLLR